MTQPAVLEYDGRTFLIPYSPTTSDEELAGLEASIDQFGVMHTIFHTPDDVLISGASRLRVCKKLGLKLADLPLREIAPDDAELLARQLNHAGRKWDRDRLVIEAKELRRAEWSTRKIALAIGVSQTTVRSYLDETDEDASGERPRSPDRVRGTDGKSYPSAKPPKPAASSTGDDASVGVEQDGGWPDRGERPRSPESDSDGADRQAAVTDANPDASKATSSKESGPSAPDADGGSDSPEPQSPSRDDQLREAGRLLGAVARESARLGVLGVVGAKLQQVADAAGLRCDGSADERKRFRDDLFRLTSAVRGLVDFGMVRDPLQSVYDAVFAGNEPAQVSGVQAGNGPGGGRQELTYEPDESCQSDPGQDVIPGLADDAEAVERHLDVEQPAVGRGEREVFEI